MTEENQIQVHDNLEKKIKEMPRSVQAYIIVIASIASSLIPYFLQYASIRKDVDVKIIVLEKQILVLQQDLKFLTLENENLKKELTKLNDCEAEKKQLINACKK